MRDHFKDIRHLHTTPIIPYRLRVNAHRHQQMPLFGIRLTNQYHIGFFFEMIASGLFGGKLVDSIVKLGEDSPYNIKPDVESSKRIIESKCIRNGNHLNLSNDQIEKYKTYQTQKPNKQISFTIWRHCFYNSMAYRGSIDELVSVITSKLQVGIILPLSIIVTLWKDHKGLSRVYANPWYCTCVRSPIINGFAFSPEASIEQIGLDPNEYEIKRYMSPKGFKVNKIAIKEFPLVVITDKDPAKWIQQHNKAWHDRLKEEVPF